MVKRSRLRLRGQRSVEKPPLASRYFKLVKPGTWFIIGSGAMYGGPTGIPMNPTLERVLDALNAAGIEVKRGGSGSPGNADSYTFTADFEGGRLDVRTGNYWFGSRGGTITGAQALQRLITLLGLRVPPRTARAWGLAGALE